MRSALLCLMPLMLAPLAGAQSSTEQFTLLDILVPSTPVSVFGWDLQVDEDADRVAITSREQGAPFSWRIFIFEREPSGWTERAQLAAPVAGTGLPLDIALRGDRLAVASEDRSGVGAVFLFEADSAGAWTHQATLQSAGSAGFGSSVALSHDTLFVGATGDTTGVGSGAVVVLVPDSSSPNGWREDGKLYSGVASEGSFGRTLDASLNRLIVSAVAQAHLFGRDSSGSPGWSKLQSIGGWGWPFWSGDVAVAEDVAVVGDVDFRLDLKYQEGAAHIYEESASGPSSWAQTAVAIPLGAGLEFGESVDIDGQYMAALDSGSVKFSSQIQIFKRVAKPGADAWQRVGIVSGGAPSYFDDYSKIQLAGRDLLAGEPNYLYQYGAVYVFRMIDSVSVP